MVYHGVILTDLMVRLRHKPMGAYRVANVLREAGYNILVIDMYSSLMLDELKALLARTISNETLFFGYSSTFFLADPYSDKLYRPHPNELAFPTSREHFIETNQYVKTLNPNIKIMYGGASVRGFIQTTKNDDRDFVIDYLVDGYSESMIVDIVNNIRDNLPQRISSLVKSAALINYDMEAKNYDFRNHYHRWHESDNVLPNEPLPLEVARGCIFKCKFCSYPLLGKKKNDMSYIRTEECLLAEILDNYEKYNTTYYNIADDTFNERTDKLEMLLRVKEKSKLDLSFGGYIRLDLVVHKPEQIPMIRDLNFVYQNYGIESFTREAAASVGKGCDPDLLVEAMNEIHHQMNGKVGMDTGMIIGLPHETPESVERSISKLADETPMDGMHFFPLSLMQSAFGKSDLWINHEKYGYTLIDDPHIPGKQTWKNDIWNYDECFKLAKHYEKKYQDSGRSRLGGSAAFGMINLGYDFMEAAKMPLREFRSEKMIAETTERFHAHRRDYFTALYSYLERQGL